MRALPSLLPPEPSLDGNVEAFAPWETMLAGAGRFMAGLLMISVVGIAAIAPGLVVQHYLWRWLPWLVTTRKSRIAYWVTAILLYLVSAYMMAVYVAPLFTSPSESPYESAPCAQGGGWFC